MSDGATSARARLDALREQDTGRFDPLRFHLMEALERRAADHDGEARRLLDERLSTLLDAYEVDRARVSRRDRDIPGSHDNAACVRGALGALVDQAVTNHGTPGSAALTAPEALEEFRTLWSRLRTDNQMRQSLQQAPTDAGPLNSTALVHRAVSLMRELSPGYLQHFLRYIDDLTWLGQMNMAAPHVDQDAPSVASGRKRARRKTRKQQE
jgi:hypothetical protein